MIQGKRVLGLITARGGSKGLPRKNILPLGGKPMIAWSVEAAKQSRYLDRVVISSDDAEIIKVAGQYGCDAPFTRPAALASDEAASLDVVLHAVEQLSGYDILVVLQPTSPLRTAADIDAALEKMQQQNAESCVSVVELDKSPYWTYQLDEKERLRAMFDVDMAQLRRQELPIAYVPNGALYIMQIEWLRRGRRFVDTNTLAYVMPKERSIDVDSALDLKLAEFYLQLQNK